MSETREKPDPDQITRSPTANDNSKKPLGLVQSFRKSFRKGSEKSAPSQTSQTEAAGGPSTESASSPVKEQRSKSMKRSKTDPNMTTSSEFFKSSRRSLRFSSKKDKDHDKVAKKELLISEAAAAAEKIVKEQEKKEEEELAEIDELYTLPELPHTPLSVMQISKLIEMEVLEEAHLNLLAMRREFQQQQQCGQDSPIDLAKKEKDLNLLYMDLRNKINTIVRDSNSMPSRNKGLLVPVARIIQEEEKRTDEPGGLPGSWMEAWREAVSEGVRVKVESVHLEQNTAGLSVHLGLLGKAIVDDLESVKRELRWSYPPSFRVFSTYVKGYHRTVGQHMKKLEQQVTELKDMYALLDWIINKYSSEKIMGNLSLQPEMVEESTELELEENVLQELKDKYCSRVQVDLKFSLDRIIQLENEEVWMKKKEPTKFGEDKDSPFHAIYMTVDGIVKNTQVLDKDLGTRVIPSCLQELEQFPSRFESEFVSRCSSLKPQPLWTHYHISYINCFSALQEHMEVYNSPSPAESETFRKEVKRLMSRLMQSLEDQFKEDVKPFLRRMMTRKWLSNNDDFDELYQRTTTLYENCTLLTPQHAQVFASHLHFHVLREYVGQLMKNKYSCKNRKHEKAAAKIREQWEKLVDVFTDMTLTHEWMFTAGDDLSDIIGQKNKADIKEHLEPVVMHYPDFSRKHLVALLNFRGLVRGREHQLILQRFKELKQKVDSRNGRVDRSRMLFGDMQVNVNTGFLSSAPMFCFHFLLPDS